MRSRVLIVAGGPSREAEVSRASARAVQAALKDSGLDVPIYELGKDLPQLISAYRPSVVFPVAHGPVGEDGCLQGLLEILEIPYVGSGVFASAAGMSKPHAKILFGLQRLPLASGVVISDSVSIPSPAELRHRLGQAVVVKPAGGGSAIGVTRIEANDPDSAIAEAVRSSLRYDREVLVESYKKGLEVSCGVLESADGRPVALPPTLIISRGGWYDFASRYATQGSTHLCPAPFPPVLNSRVQEIAVRAHLALGARDLSRADFVVSDDTESAELTLLEVNTLPGMTATSLFPEAASRTGIPFPTLCMQLVERAALRGIRRAVTPVPLPG